MESYQHHHHNMFVAFRVATLLFGMDGDEADDHESSCCSITIDPLQSTLVITCLLRYHSVVVNYGIIIGTHARSESAP